MLSNKTTAAQAEAATEPRTTTSQAAVEPSSVVASASAAKGEVMDDLKPFPWSQVRRPKERESERARRERIAKEQYAADCASCAETMAWITGQVKP